MPDEWHRAWRADERRNPPRPMPLWQRIAIGTGMGWFGAMLAINLWRMVSAWL